MKKDNLQRLLKLADASQDANDFGKRGCQAGMFVSMAEGRRMWQWMERLQQLKDAAEHGVMVDFNSGLEAEFYREAYVRFHAGVIDVQAVEVPKAQIGDGR